MGAFCTNCGTPLPDGAGFCPKCGTKVEVFRCPSCGKELDFGVDFCIYCGQRLKEEAPMAEPEQETSAPMEETTSQPEPKAPQEEKRSKPAEETQTSEAAEPVVEAPTPGVEAAEQSDAPKGFIWCYKEEQGADQRSHTVGVRVEGKFLFIEEEIKLAAQQSERLPTQKIDLSEIKDVEINSGYLVITEWSGKITRIKGEEGDPDIVREAAVTILNRIGKDPSELREEPLDDQTREFIWVQKKPRRFYSAVTTVRVWMEQEMLHIQKELSDTISGHKNTLPEETIPLSEIESVYIQKKGPSIAVILLLFLCVPLTIYICASGKFDLWTAALWLLALVLVGFRYRGQIKRYQLIIIKKNRKRIVLKGDGDSLQTMDEAAVAILTRAGIDPWVARSTEKRAGHKPVWIILGVVAVLLLGVLIVPELYLQQSFPAGVIKNPDVRNYVGTEISGDLNYQFATEVTGGKLVKNTAMPQYKDGLFTYLFVDCVYNVTIKDDNDESASGQVTVDCSFSVKPFSSRPEDIIFNGFTYSDEISQFVKKADRLAADDPVGCWKLTFVEWADGEPYSGGIQSYFCIYDDSSFLYIDDGNVSGQGAWSSSGKALTIQWSDNDDLRTGWIEDDKLYFQGPAYISQYEKLSPSPDAVWDIIGETGNNSGKSGSYIDTDYYTIDIPADWVGLFNCYEWKSSDSLGAYQYSLSFCEKGSEEDGYGGHVFSVELWRDESYTEGENYQLLGSLAATDPGRPPTLVGYIVITYPTDIQYSEAHAETYMKMYHETDDVLSSLTAKDGYAFFAE